MYEHNVYLGRCFVAYAKFMRKLSYRPATWSTAGLWGHADVNPILPVSEVDMNILKNCGIRTVGQIYDTVDGTALHSHLPLKECPADIPRDTWNRVQHIHSNITRLPIIRGGIVNAALNIHTIRGTGSFSQINRILYTESIEKEITAPPSYYTRQRDNLPLPSIQEYCQAYTHISQAKTATTRAIEFGFATLNRTVWTGKKQTASDRHQRMEEEGNAQNIEENANRCTLCGMEEDTAHILTNCDRYSYRLWELFSEILTMASRTFDLGRGRIGLTFSNIMYHTPILSMPKDLGKAVHSVLLEIKRDIYVRRTDRCLTRARARYVYNDERIKLHISISCDRVLRIIHYKGKENAFLTLVRDLCLNEE
jgi:hypothetical protein